MLIQILSASLIGSVCALIGGAILLWKEKFAKRISLVLVSFAVGSLIGAAFLELIPEALAEGGSYETIAPFIVIGIFAMFIFERALHWYHRHDGHDEEETNNNQRVVATSIIVGDSLHNFVDGIAIALSFMVGTEVGIATTIAVFFHEVPQEIGDFGVLLHLGYSKSRVFLLNFVTALSTVLGALLAYFLSEQIESYAPMFLGFAAGTFLYIAISDLLPELRHKRGPGSIGHIMSMIAGVAVIALLGVLLPE